MPAAMPPAPVAASETWRPISAVVAVCSSTAEAIVSEYPLNFWMTSAIWPMASTAPPPIAARQIAAPGLRANAPTAAPLIDDGDYAKLRDTWCVAGCGRETWCVAGSGSET